MPHESTRALHASTYARPGHAGDKLLLNLKGALPKELNGNLMFTHCMI
jgi:hypothetical protein